MKNNTILFITALFGAAMSGSTLADPAPANQAAPAASSHSQGGQSGFNVVGSGPVRNILPLSGIPRPLVSTDEVIDVGGSDTFCQKGKKEIVKGNWHAALQDFQQALRLYAEDREALYGQAQCVAALGDTATALKTYRSLVYTDDPSRYGTVPGDGFQENNVPHLMQFALLLNRLGQTTEALSLYNRAAYLRDYQDSQFNGGKPHLKVLLPELVEERTLPEAVQVRYTPEHLQALAEIAIAHEEDRFGENKETITHMQEAVKLYPDSPVTHYYLGEMLLTTDRAGSKAAYQKAAELGDDQTQAAVKAELKRVF